MEKTDEKNILNLWQHKLEKNKESLNPNLTLDSYSDRFKSICSVFLQPIYKSFFPFHLYSTGFFSVGTSQLLWSGPLVIRISATRLRYVVGFYCKIIDYASKLEAYSEV